MQDSEIKVLKTIADVYEDPNIDLDEYVEDKYINDITLQFMMNREMYENYILSQNESTKEEIKEEMKFYRSRIFQLTKVLLLSEKEQRKYFLLNPDFDISKIQFDVFLTFNAFVKNVIQNFKMIDTNDILQEDYPKEVKKDIIELDPYIDPVFGEKPESTLDNFVISDKPQEQQILPLQKKINLSDPFFKKKGIRKNKQI